jgi:hypothetical protein
MAQNKKPKAGKKKKAPQASRALVPVKTGKRKAKTGRSGNGPGLESLGRLIEHPLVVELLSVGAIAAVAAIADHNVKTRTGEGEKGSGKALKAAGKAAADAIGKRLSAEVDEIRKAAKKAGKKTGV